MHVDLIFDLIQNGRLAAIFDVKTGVFSTKWHVA